MCKKYLTNLQTCDKAFTTVKMPWVYNVSSFKGGEISEVFYDSTRGDGDSYMDAQRAFLNAQHKLFGSGAESSVDESLLLRLTENGEVKDDCTAETFRKRRVGQNSCDIAASFWLTIPPPPKPMSLHRKTAVMYHQ